MKLIASAPALCAFIILSFSFSFAQPAPRSQSQPPAQSEGAQQPQELHVTEYRLPPGKMAQAEALYKTRTLLYLIDLIYGIVILWILLQLHTGPAFRDLAEHISANRIVRTLIFVPLFLLVIAITTLPLEIYGHHLSLAYGLSVQRWDSWMADWAKGQGISLAISIPAVLTLFWIMRKNPQRWWLYFWLLTLPFAVLLIFVAPVILDPIFNTFQPLEKTQPLLVSQIERVTQRGGLNIPRDRMFEMEASAKVTTYNAYVTGIGATKRVVVWDNTARDLTGPETLFVFGHEMGHYVLNHIYKGLAFYAVTSLLGFWLGRRMVLAMLSRWGDAWHIRSLDDLAALPVLMLVLSFLTFVGEPIGNAFSRHIEHQADIYALEVTHGLFPNNAQVAASSFQKLGEKSYDYPNPNTLLVFWSYSHPSIADRIHFCLRYDPWNTPAGPRYVK